MFSHAMGESLRTSRSGLTQEMEKQAKWAALARAACSARYTYSISYVTFCRLTLYSRRLKAQGRMGGAE